MNLTDALKVAEGGSTQSHNMHEADVIRVFRALATLAHEVRTQQALTLELHSPPQG